MSRPDDSHPAESEAGPDAGPLGPQPAATAEPPMLDPGGVDSVADQRYGSTFEEPTTPDMHPDSNPAIEDVVPDEVTEPDDKQQEPDEPSETHAAGESDDADAGEAGEPTA